MARYALLLARLESPSAARLARAFDASGARARLDAPTVAHLAFGILLDNLTATAASKLHLALEHEGVAVDVVEESLLPALPRRRVLARGRIDAEGMTYFTPFGKERQLAWSSIDIAALGSVRRKPRHVVRSVIPGIEEDLETVETEDPTTAEDLVIDLVSSGERQALRIIADDFLYDCLGGRMRARARDNFPILARDILERCEVLPNRGAARFLLKHPDYFTYPSWAAFDEETRWLLWRVTDRQHASAEPPRPSESTRAKRKR